MKHALPARATKPLPALSRNRIAVLIAATTAACLGLAVSLSDGPALLMPGALTSAHGAIGKCSSCHTKSGGGKLSWVHGLVGGDPLADSKACLACHKMHGAAFNAHSAPDAVLKQSTQRLKRIAALTPAPRSARAQNVAFPTDAILAGGVPCATCHQEHQGAGFDLKRISDGQCRSCHVVKFDSFDGHHPDFEDYPFRRRTRIIFDHAGHFDNHFPEVAKKDAKKRIPSACSDCHNSHEDRRVMAVASFDDTCSSCHLDQITGKERASGPKGIAFLSLPGLDLETLKAKNASIGEWPEASEAPLTPFMMVLLSRNERGRALIKTVSKLHLQDLTKASDVEIKAATDLAWQIKELLYALINGKASDVLSNLDTLGRTRSSASPMADLTAGLPRDVVIGAQQQWLPNLAAEMTKGRSAIGQGQQAAATAPVTAESEPPVEPSGQSNETQPDQESSEPAADTANEAPDAGASQDDSSASPQDAGAEAGKSRLDPPPCSVSIFGQCLVPEGAATAPESDATIPAPDGASPAPSADVLPAPTKAGLADIVKLTQTGGAAAAKAKPSTHVASSGDELLSPTQEELRKIKAHYRKAGQTYTEQNGAVPVEDPGSAAKPETSADPTGGITSSVDPESWADYGGWYRQDYTIFYSPTGHKDRFITSWILLTGFEAPEGESGPGAAVFETLTRRDAPGACTKCHSIDRAQGRKRFVNFSPVKTAAKQGRFTRFVHEPHLGLLGDRGCLTCHELNLGKPPTASATAGSAGAAEPAGKTALRTSLAERNAAKSSSPYLRSFEHGDPGDFVPGFSPVSKEVCQTCHNAREARQDCLLCHAYHLNGVVTPALNTKLPGQ